MVLPAPTAGGSPRTVALALEQPPEVMTVAALKEAISRRSAQAYCSYAGEEEKQACCCGGCHEHEEEEDGMEGIPAVMQRLTLGGRHLPDERTLAECAVTE